MLELELCGRAQAGSSSGHPGFLGFFVLILQGMRREISEEEWERKYKSCLIPSFSSGASMVSYLLLFCRMVHILQGLWLLISLGSSCPGSPRSDPSRVIWPVIQLGHLCSLHQVWLIGLSIIKECLALQNRLTLVMDLIFLKSH